MRWGQILDGVIFGPLCVDGVKFWICVKTGKSVLCKDRDVTLATPTRLSKVHAATRYYVMQYELMLQNILRN